MNDLDTLKMQSIVLDYMSDSIFVHDMNGKFIYINTEAHESRGYTKDELLNMHVKDLDAPMDEESIVKMKKNIKKMKEQGFVTFEIKHKTKDNTIIPVEIRSQIFILHDEKMVISVARDITDRQKVQDTLQVLATTDSLTGLYNRHKFELFYNSEVKKRKSDDSVMCLLLIDLDFFKKVNDNFGHSVGDIVIKEFSDVLASETRTDDIVARIGGEEFVVLLKNVDIDKASRIAERMRIKTQHMKIKSGDQDISITASFGLTTSNNFSCLEQCLKMADDAMYQSKNNGRNKVTIFEPQPEKVL